MTDKKDNLEADDLTEMSGEDFKSFNKLRLIIMDEIESTLHKQMKDVFQKELNDYFNIAKKDYSFQDFVKENNLEYVVDKANTEKIDIRNCSIQTKLGEYLESNGITKTWLSESTGINRVTLLNIIKNPNTVTLINALKIAKVLDKDIFELFECK